MMGTRPGIAYVVAALGRHAAVGSFMVMSTVPVLNWFHEWRCRTNSQYKWSVYADCDR